MDEFRMLENIRQHSIIVARVAELIAFGLLRAGVTLPSTDHRWRLLMTSEDHLSRAGVTMPRWEGNLPPANAPRGCRYVGGMSAFGFSVNGTIAEKRSSTTPKASEPQRRGHTRRASALHLDRYGEITPRSAENSADFAQCKMVEEKLFVAGLLADDIGAIMHGHGALVTPLPSDTARGRR